MSAQPRMTKRRYMVEEIDLMRESLRSIQRYQGNHQVDDKVIEDRLRTHMLNGTKPEDLHEHRLVVGQEWLKRQQATWAEERRIREEKAAVKPAHVDSSSWTGRSENPKGRRWFA